jgi:hypothetical protein
MARIRLEQIDSIMSSDSPSNILNISGSVVMTGSMQVTGSIDINSLDTFGDSSTPTIIDLGGF